MGLFNRILLNPHFLNILTERSQNISYYIHAKFENNKTMYVHNQPNLYVPYNLRNVGSNIYKTGKGPVICYVITFLGFLDPPPPLRKHVFSTENN